MKPEPTNGWTRAEMVEFAIEHAHELSSAMNKMPDFAGGETHTAVVALLEELRAEYRTFRVLSGA